MIDFIVCVVKAHSWRKGRNEGGVEGEMQSALAVPFVPQPLPQHSAHRDNHDVDRMKPLACVCIVGGDN